MFDLNEDNFRKYLKKEGRSQSAIERCIKHISQFATYMQNHRDRKSITEANANDVQRYVDWIEGELHASAKLHLWALRYYFAYTSNTTLYALANQLRQQRIKRQPFKIKDFAGVQLEYTERLIARGIETTEQMLTAG